MIYPKKKAMLKPNQNFPDRAFPSKLFLEVTTRCNLRCTMCVKQSFGNGIGRTWDSLGQFRQQADLGS